MVVNLPFVANGEIRRSTRLWIENAHQSSEGDLASNEVCDVVRTFQSDEQFFAILVSNPEGSAEGTAKAAQMAGRASLMLEQATSLDTVMDSICADLSNGEHTPFSILQVLGGCEAHLVECEAPPLFLTRGGQVALLPVLETASHGQLVRECHFLLQDGDHMAMVSEGFIRVRGWSRHWGWRDIAVSTRRWTDTGCDAKQLLGALISTYRRLAKGEFDRDAARGRAPTVIAMHVRPLRTATVWSGPPADPSLDRTALGRLMAEPGQRVICGGTTARIAARLLGARLDIERRPPDGWAQVPPMARLKGVDLVTEGRITLDETRERLAAARDARDLPRTGDGATRLARTLLAADSIHFVVGLTGNHQQASDGCADNTYASVPLRQAVVQKLTDNLKTRGKLVSVEYL